MFRRLFLCQIFIAFSGVCFSQHNDSIINGLNQSVIPIKYLKGGNEFDDLMPLKKLLLNKQIVAVGEATHGTKEFFQLKHRLFEFLVKELDFKIFIIEGFFSNTEQVNEYVLYGKGDPYKAIIGMGYGIWYTQEVFDLIEWIKDYNEKLTFEDKIQVFGCDVPAPQVTIDKIQTFFHSENLSPLILDAFEILNKHKFRSRFSRKDSQTLKSSFVEPGEYNFSPARIKE